MSHPVLPKGYVEQAASFCALILEALPDNEWLLEADNPWDLFKVENLAPHIKKMDLSLYQADWAFQRAKNLYKQEEKQP